MTLDEVLDHYAAGGRTLTGQYSGVGHDNPFKDSLIKGFSITSSQRNDLLSFLKSLTDQRFLNNPEHADPWAESSSRDSSKETPQ